jgi:hypothetical protein
VYLEKEKMNDPSSIQRRLALKMRLNKIDGVGVTGPIILHEVLTKMSFSSKLVQGFCSVNDEGSCWHVIVMADDGLVLDIGHTLACLQDPEFSKCKFVLSQEEPEGEYQKDQLVIDSWEIYQKDPKDFWKKMPKKVQDFRAKMMREFK